MVSIILTLVLAFAVLTAAYESDDPASYEFAHKFAAILKGDAKDATVFESARIPGEQAGPMYGRVWKEFLLDSGMSPGLAEESGDLFGKAVVRSLDRVSPAELAVMVGYNLATCLETAGRLDAGNAARMAGEVAGFFHDFLMGRDISSDEAKFAVMLEGYEAYFKQMGISMLQLVPGMTKIALEMLA